MGRGSFSISKENGKITIYIIFQDKFLQKVIRQTTAWHLWDFVNIHCAKIQNILENHIGMQGAEHEEVTLMSE